MDYPEIKLAEFDKGTEDKHLGCVLTEINESINGSPKVKQKIKNLCEEMRYESREQKLETMEEIDALKRKIKNAKNLPKNIMDKPLFQI
jgi:protein-arginine kinase activator protein McsA